MSSASFESVLSRQKLGLITFHAIGFGVVFFLFSYFPAADNFARAAEYGGKTAVGFWVGFVLALVFYQGTRRLARLPFSTGVACSVAFAIVSFAGDVLEGGEEGPFASLARGAVLGMFIGLVFGKTIFASGNGAASSGPIAN